MRLGEALVRDGVISQAELDEALEAQVHNGGKLGTILVVLGHLDQKQLYAYLARRFAGAHIFPPGEEPEVSLAAIAAVPRKIAEYYRLMPMSIDGAHVHVALLDPTRLSALAAVRSATKKKVVPHVVSEDVIDVLLHRHYGVVVKARPVVRRAPIALPNVVIADAPAPPASEQAADTPAADDDIPFADAADLLEEIVEDDGFAIDLDVRSAIVPLQHQLALAAIAGARDDRQIVSAVLGGALTVYARAAFFRVHPGDGTLTGWDAAGVGVDRLAFERVNARIESRSIFGVALSGRAPFLGNVARTPENIALFAAMGWGAPRSAFCVGLWKQQAAALLYADNGSGSQMSVNVSGLVELATRAAEKLGAP
jgi:hypothetical protein